MPIAAFKSTIQAGAFPINAPFSSFKPRPLAPGETTPGLSDTIRIDESVAQQVNKVTDGSTVTYQYKYDGYSFNLDAEVDAVQTHNAKAAIKSAWGVDVSVSDDESSIGF